MDFLTAVRALQAGECEGIKLPKYSRYLTGNLHWSGGKDGEWEYDIPGIENLLSDDWELVNSKPLTETREVKRYLLVNKKTGEESAWASRGDEPYDASAYDVVTLVGTRTVPVKRPVKRREEITWISWDAWDFTKGSAPCPDMPRRDTAKFYVEWEE